MNGIDGAASVAANQLRGNGDVADNGGVDAAAVGVESGYVAPSPSLAKWVALTGAIVCVSLVFGLALGSW